VRQKKRGMKKSLLLLVVFISFNCISCGSSVKKGMEESTPESVINDQAEDTTIYKVTKFVIPKYSENVNIYKSPSKASQILVFKECMEDGEDNCGFFKWTKTKSEGETNVIPASKDFIFWYNVNVLPVISEEKGWYKVYVRLYPNLNDNNFIGFIPKEECIETTVMDVSLEDVKQMLYDRQQDTPIYSHNGFYVKWGMYEPEGNAFFVGKIVDGKAYESEWISYGVNYPSYEGDNEATNKISVSNEKKTFEFSNKRYAKKGEYGGYEADFSKLSDEDFNKVISLSENKYPNIYIKIKGAPKLFLIREGETVNGRKIVWGF
jgi:hypothetical protein